MQLHPRESFTITRQLQNPYITDTFYVRAIVRNAKTDATIDTLDLDDKTSQRFTKVWQVPADVSGQGFWISIVTSVYTDSGYTTKSENYGDEENTYLVQDRFNHNIGGVGVGGGADIDYKRIKKMIDEAADKIISSIPEENNIVTTKTVVEKVIIPEVRVVEKLSAPDLGPVLKAIENVGKKVDDKEVTEVPEPKEVNLAPLEKTVSAIEDAVSAGFEKVEKRIQSLSVKVEIANPLIDAKVQAEPTVMDPRITRIMAKR